MPNPTNAPSPLPAPPTPASFEVPQGFFSPVTERPPLEENLSRPPAPAAWVPSKAHIWYDAIIDWMFANPGGSIKDCAAALGRHEVTIGLITRSDLFKDRYAQRRGAFNLELDRRLVGRLTAITEKGLDAMISALDKKGDTIPIPLLNEITKTAMDRLGYGSSRSEHPSVNVSVNTTQVAEVVSADSLAKARENMRRLEQMKTISSSPRPDEPLGQTGEEAL